MRSSEANSEAKCGFNDRNNDGLMNVQSPREWWATLKFALFSSSSSLPPLVGRDGRVVCESVGKADLLSVHFVSKQYRGRIIKTIVKLQCSVPCISSYNMKARMCQQCCKSGSSKIYKFIPN